MSIKLTQLVWNTELALAPSERLVLFCLANFANDNNDLLCCPSYYTLEKKTGLHRSTIIRIIDRLCKDDILIKNKITLDNRKDSSNHYSFNEETLNGGRTTLPYGSHHATPMGRTTRPNKYISNNITDNKKNNIKKRNSEKNEEYENQAKELIDMFIRLTGKKYRYSPMLMKPIISRLKEGYTLQECRTVISKKYRDWDKSPEMRMYIRPITIFRASKFPEYLAECVTPEEKNRIKEEYNTKIDKN